MSEKKTSRRAVMAGMLASTAAPAVVSAKTTEPRSPGYAHARSNSESAVGIGENIEIAFEGDRCIHARFCVAWLPNVFRPGKEPWMDPDADTAEEIAAIVRNCSSGALQYHRLDGAPQEKAPQSNTVMVREAGPLAFRADLKLDGKPIGNRATLCRCGQSGNKPFCDGSHNRVEFDATGEPETVADEDNKRYFEFVANPAGLLEVKTTPDGPYLVSGSLQVQSGTGRKVDTTTTSMRLCACGKSKNKPFCDGSHLEDA